MNNLKKKLLEIKKDMDNSPYEFNHELDRQKCTMFSYAAGYAPEMSVRDVYEIIDRIIYNHIENEEVSVMYEELQFMNTAYEFWENNRKILGVEYVRSDIVRLICVYDIVFELHYDGNVYCLYEIDGDVIYFLADNLRTMNDVYERMCKEHGCLRNED